MECLLEQVANCRTEEKPITKENYKELGLQPMYEYWGFGGLGVRNLRTKVYMQPSKYDDFRLREVTWLVGDF